MTTRSDNKKYSAGWFTRLSVVSGSMTDAIVWVRVDASRHKSPELARKAARKYQRTGQGIAGLPYDQHAWYQDAAHRYITVTANGETTEEN